MKKGWKLDIAYVERREKLAKERAERRTAQYMAVLARSQTEAYLSCMQQLADKNALSEP